MTLHNKYLKSIIPVALLCGSAVAQTDPTAPRTHSYTEVSQGNAASDNTVIDYTRRPTLIAGKQYFAGSGDPSLIDGFYAFNGLGMSWFGSVTGTAAGGGIPAGGEVRSGVATGAFGAGVIFNFKKVTTEDAAGNKTKTVAQGDGYGAFGDFSLGSIGDVYGEVSVYTGGYLPTYTKVEPAVGATAETDPWVLHVMAGWKKDASTEGTHSINVELAFNHLSLEQGTPSVSTSGNLIALLISHGYILKAQPTYSVFLGSNTNLYYSKDDLPAGAADPDASGISIAPNIVFQKTLGKGFEASAGARGVLSFDMASNDALPPNIPLGAEGSALFTTGAFVDLGLRWVHENFAVEGTVSPVLLHNGPNFISGTGPAPMFARVGLALGI